MSDSTNFPELIKNLDSWAEFTTDSPIAALLRKWITTDLAPAHPSMAHAAALNDLSVFMSAVYAGGVATGKASVKPSTEYATFYIVWTTEDERGTRGSVVGVYTNSADAEKAKEGKGWWGGPGDVEKADGWFVGDYVMFPRVKVLREDIDVNLPQRTEEKRQAALAKLTEEEKQLLGVK